MNAGLKTAREQIALTQGGVAALVGISERQYQRYESEDSIPPIHTAIKIAAVLKKSVEILFYRN